MVKCLHISLGQYVFKTNNEASLSILFLKLINYVYGNKPIAWLHLGHMDAPLYPAKEQMKSSVYWISKHT